MIQNWRAKSARELGRTENHVYLAPHVLLRDRVAHYTVWTAAQTAAPVQPAPTAQEAGVPDALTLVPDAAGCIVMHWSNGLHAKLWGVTTRAVTVHSTGVPVRIFIEFLPGGLFYFAGACQSELANCRLDLKEIAPDFFKGLERLLERANSTQELAGGLDALLLPVLLAREAPSAALSAVRALEHARGLLSVGELSALEGYSPRHLDRTLAPFLGMGPKTFARLLRVNTAMRLLDSGISLTYLAQEAGFYDQAHFVRDFKQLCGVAPSLVRDSMSDFYKEPFKL